MKLFALYLPQFHETEENNRWWGEGFTEWTHVRAAKPLYKGHRQPIVPENDNYYNLMDKETVLWQTKLMHDYGVDGMVYYHYYFQGKKLLEKPAENLLKWTDIDQPFFFCWANHTWYRAQNGKKTTLIEQTYGTEADWQAHFDYLLPFFQDSRYEKKDNKPVFMLYADFPEKAAGMDYFDKRCKEAGFDGLYLIETVISAHTDDDYCAFRKKACAQTQKFYLREPVIGQAELRRRRRFSPARIRNKLMHVLSEKGWVSWAEEMDGNRMYKAMEDILRLDSDLCHGVFFSWDNTPRHGVRGLVISPPSKERFFSYTRRVKEDEYIFINAWNEWAEGMILEPTTHNGHQYLEWIRQFRECEKV